nr:dTDP-4-dehydrorhamnose reductase [Sneathiella chinensis]
MVTGGEGQVGSALERAGREAGHDMRMMSRRALDITSVRSAGEGLSRQRPDLVINAAAYTAVDRAEEETEQAFSINQTGPQNLAETCQKMGLPLIHISTDFVFDGLKDGPYLETDPCAPLGVYGQSKWLGEQAVTRTLDRHLILRTAWVFGGATSFVETMRRLAGTRQDISVVDDQKGGPTPAAAIADCLLVMAEKALAAGFSDWGIYHFCGTPPVSWYEFAGYILKDRAGVTVHPIPTRDYPTPAKRPANSVLACGRIADVFGIQQPDWRDYLAD